MVFWKDFCVFFGNFTVSKFLFEKLELCKKLHMYLLKSDIDNLTNI